MAYVVVSVKGEEVGRWSLDRPVTIGRAAECDIAVRDIQLSRRHCQIVPYRSGWVAQDLDSKNGTRCEGEPVRRRGLADGDELSMGKTTVRFHLGQLPGLHRPPVKRPADPAEALSNTVTAFDPIEVENYRRSTKQPRPQPEPPAPAAYAREDLYTLLSEIASSSWDSIYAQASKPDRPTPQVDLVMRQRSGTADGHDRDSGRPASAPARATAGAGTTATLPQRTRLGFAEELQAREGQARDAQARPTTVGLPRRVVRPKTPMAADVQSIAREAAREVALAGFTAFAGPIPRVPADPPAERVGLLGRSLRKVSAPIAALGRWLYLW